MSYQQSALPVGWNEAARLLERAVDALGTPIDAAIMDVVIALNVLGVVTDSSCEGHLHHGLAAPWVDFHAVGTEAIRRQASDANRKFREAEEQDASRSVLDQLNEEMFRLAHEENVAYYQGSWQVHQALEAFYREHHVSYDQQLYVHNDSFGNSRLQSHGSDYQPQRPAEVQSEKLALYQQEIQAFAFFLKSAYLLARDSLDKS